MNRRSILDELTLEQLRKRARLTRERGIRVSPELEAAIAAREAAQRTPEAHHDRLIKAIDYELNVYGVVSLAGIIVSMLDARGKTDDNSPKATYYRTAELL